MNCKLKSGLFLALASLLLCSCQTTTVDSVRNANPVGSANPIQDIRIQTDKSLGKAVTVLGVVEGVASGNLLKVEIRLRNNKKTSANYSYKFEWLDYDGMVVTGNQSSWKSIRLLGKEEKSVAAIAISPKATDFVFKIQESNPKLL